MFALYWMQLRMEEKRIVSSTMDAVRARLAPIRGIPTKQGNLQDPNSVSLSRSARPVLLPRSSSCMRRTLVHAMIAVLKPQTVALCILLIEQMRK